jgi:hypothetical protein
MLLGEGLDKVCALVKVIQRPEIIVLFFFFEKISNFVFQMRFYPSMSHLVLPKYCGITGMPFTLRRRP